MIIGNSDTHQLITLGQCTPVNVTIVSKAPNETVILSTGEYFENQYKIEVNLEQPCPIGFHLNDIKNECICDDRIKTYLKRCDINNKEELYKKMNNYYEQYWIAPYNNSNDIYLYKNCPHGYCVTNESFFFEKSSICANNQTGVLCGECRQGLSVYLGGEKCDDCSDIYPTLLSLYCLGSWDLLLLHQFFSHR